MHRHPRRPGPRGAPAGLDAVVFRGRGAAGDLGRRGRRGSAAIRDRGPGESACPGRSAGERRPGGAARKWMEADLATSVDLEKGPLSHAAVFRLGPERLLFYYRIHHILVDAYGVHLLRRRLAELCGKRPGPAGFEPLHTLAEEEAGYRRSPRFEADRAYWTARFADRPDPVQLPGVAPPVAGRRACAGSSRCPRPGAPRWTGPHRPPAPPGRPSSSRPPPLTSAG
ncbi:condensation domain-containing protein [Streptomyces nogalater]